VCRPDETAETQRLVSPQVWLENQPHFPSSLALAEDPRHGAVDARLKAEHDGGRAGTNIYSRRRVGSNRRRAGGHHRGQSGGVDAGGASRNRVCATPCERRIGRVDASRAPSFLCLSQESRAPKSLGVKDFFRAIWFVHGADAPWLDFC